MQRQMHLVQVSQCYVLLNKLRLPEVVSAHFPNALPAQRLENIRVTHQSQVTRRGLSYKAVFLSSVNFPRETFHGTKRFAVVREEGIAEGISEKEPDPPPSEIQNSTAPPYAPGDPTEDGVLNNCNREEDIALVRNQGVEVDYDMKPAPKNIPLLDTNAADKCFEGQKCGWDGIDCRAVVAHNNNKPSFKNGWSPQIISYINIFLQLTPLKWLRIVLPPSKSIDTKEVDIAPLTYGYLLGY